MLGGAEDSVVWCIVILIIVVIVISSVAASVKSPSSSTTSNTATGTVSTSALIASARPGSLRGFPNHPRAPVVKIRRRPQQH